ncbi:alpha/beta fold hydrolase [Dokdonia donghaensis]|uniref:Alpha/beta hydrolase n=1 Tax=Dokdonia donghaensis DSW-1 TaxID=1300343 RepID=A0A0A2GT07_9FLAO|nr:alpha/beta hydrolase [Dokdonia donghaensis]ANH61397.1 Alpha/beta hydrolase family protein [Dokdonia donghaensis DSW-1]KGO05421.1 alpha/beta hydrolase [Dokdonia donghaensis DSW-1]
MIHVYLMPGMAANPSIFENISLPSASYTTHLLEWQLPEPGESLSQYALRMTQFIKHDDIVLLGVSFGGVLVQEMAKHIKVRKLILVSTVKSKYELPRRMKLSRKLKLYKALPASLIEDVDKLAKYAFGETIKNRVDLYQKYLSMNDRRYMKWAVKEMVCWDQETPTENAIHIHGTADKVFPVKYIDNCIKVQEGTHIMVITRAKWFNEHLPKLIENE